MTTLQQQLKTWALRLYYRTSSRKAWAAHPRSDDFSISNLLIPTRTGEVTARMYHGQADCPIIIYFHGGGWVIGDLNTHDPFCRALSKASGCSLLSIGYRLAPEHPFPAAHDDCLDATKWIIDNLNALAPNSGKAVLAGDSAGGNLAACTMASLIGEPRISGTIMIYPVIEHYLAGLRFFTEHAKSGPLTSSIMRWFFDTYLGAIAAADPKTKTIFVSRRCDYSNFPPSLLVTAERDPLRDDGKRLATVMRQAGVAITYQHFPNEAHGFACSQGATAGHQQFVELATHWLGELSAH